MQSLSPLILCYLSLLDPSPLEVPPPRGRLTCDYLRDYLCELGALAILDLGVPCFLKVSSKLRYL